MRNIRQVLLGLVLMLGMLVIVQPMEVFADYSLIKKYSYVNHISGNKYEIGYYTNHTDNSYVGMLDGSPTGKVIIVPMGIPGITSYEIALRADRQKYQNKTNYYYMNLELPFSGTTYYIFIESEAYLLGSGNTGKAKIVSDSSVVTTPGTPPDFSGGGAGSDLTTIESRMNTLNSYINNINTSIGNVRTQVEGIKTAITNQTNSQTTAINGVKTEIATMGNKLEAAENEIRDAIQSLITSTNSLVTAYNTQMANQATALANIKTEVAGVKTAIGTQTTAINNQTTSQTNAITALKNETSGVKDAIAGQTTAITNAINGTSGVGGAITNQTTALANQTSALNNIKTQIENGNKKDVMPPLLEIFWQNSASITTLLTATLIIYVADDSNDAIQIKINDGSWQAYAKTKIVNLNMGANKIVVFARDASGNVVSKSISIMRI